MKLYLFTIVFITAAMIATTILGHLGTETYADFPPSFVLTLDQLERLEVDSNNRDSIYTFKCPMFSEKDEFTIDMSLAPTSSPNMANDYFNNYERIMCNDLSPSEIMNDLSDKMEDLSNQEDNENN